MKMLTLLAFLISYYFLPNGDECCFIGVRTADSAEHIESVIIKGREDAADFEMREIVLRGEKW